MKKLFIAVSVVLACMFCACGGSKQVVTTTNDYPEEFNIKKTESQLLAEEKPATRAWGEAYDTSESFAKQYAALSARGEMATSLAAKITQKVRMNGIDFSQAAVTDTEGKGVQDVEKKREILVKQVADEVVTNTIIINTDTKWAKNRQYHVYVCVEYNGDVAEMAKAVNNRIQQLIPDEDRLKMEYQFQKFEEELKEELEKMGK